MMVLFVFMLLFDSSRSIDWTNIGFTTFNVLIIKLNPLLIFSYFCHMLSKLDQKVLSSSQRAFPSFEVLVTCLFTLILVSGFVLIGQILTARPGEATESIENGIQIGKTWLQALSPSSFPWAYSQVKLYYTKVLPKRSHLNVHTIGYHPQTQKLELYCISP